MKFKTVHLVTLSTVLLIHYTVALPSYPGVDVPRLLTLNPSRIVTEICTRVVSRFGRSRAKRDVTWYHTAESAVSLLLFFFSLLLLFLRLTRFMVTYYSQLEKKLWDRPDTIIHGLSHLDMPHPHSQSPLRLTHSSELTCLDGGSNQPRIQTD